MNKVCIIVGHYINKADKGALAYNGQYESIINLNIAKNLTNKLQDFNISSLLVTKDDENYLDHIHAFNPDFCIELHLNSASVKAFGCEALTLEDSDSVALADIITDEIEAFLKIKQRRNRGILVVGSGGRGYKNLLQIKNLVGCPCVIVEPAFINIKTEESEFFLNNQGLYVMALIVAIKKFYAHLNNEIFRNTLPLEYYEKSPTNTYEKFIGLGKELFTNKLY